MAKYRKKPIVVDAFLWTGGIDQTEDPLWIIAALKDRTAIICDDTMVIRALEGEMSASFGDYIIRGVAGEIYPCKPDIFARSYDPA